MSNDCVNARTRRGSNRGVCVGGTLGAMRLVQRLSTREPFDEADGDE